MGRKQLGPGSPALTAVLFGGADGSRTHGLLSAIQALSQLSYGPMKLTGIQNEFTRQRVVLYHKIARLASGGIAVTG